LETPPYASIESVDPVEWNNVVGTVTIDSDTSQASDVHCRRRSIDLASYNALTPPGGESYCWQPSAIYGSGFLAYSRTASPVDVPARAARSAMMAIDWQPSLRTPRRLR